MTLTSLLKTVLSSGRAFTLGAVLYGCGGNADCRDETPYLEIQFSMKDGSYSFQDSFEWGNQLKNPHAFRCSSGVEDEHGVNIHGWYTETGDYSYPGVYIMASEDYRGPGAYDVPRAQLGIPIEVKVGELGGIEKAGIHFENREGVTSLDALIVSKDVGRRCVSGAVELYLDHNLTEQPISKDVPGTLQFEAVCEEFVESN